MKRFALLVLATAAGWGMVGCSSSTPPTMALPPQKSDEPPIPSPPNFPPDKKVDEKRVPDPPEIR